MPGVAAGIFGPLSEANINVDMIVQNVAADGELTDMTFTVGKADFERALQVLEGVRTSVGFRNLITSQNVVKISVIGVGMRAHRSEEHTSELQSLMRISYAVFCLTK